MAPVLPIEVVLGSVLVFIVVLVFARLHALFVKPKSESEKTEPRHWGVKMLRRLPPLILAFLICSSFSHGSHADSDAENLAKMLGSVIGMANACGYAVSEDWLAASTKTIKDTSIGSDDLRSAQKFKDEYSRVTLAQQKAQPQMNCADVLRSLGNFERKLVE